MMKIKQVLEARHENNGITLEHISAYQCTRPVEIKGTNPEHSLSLVLSPLPALRECYMSNSSARPFEVGNLMFMPANVPYRIVTGGGPHRWISFKITVARFSEMTGLKGNIGLGFVPNMLGTPIHASMARLSTEITAPGFASDLIVDGLSEIIVADLARFAHGSTEVHQSSDVGLSPQQLRRILDFVENAEGVPLTTQDIAKVLGLSTRHLARMFKISTGRTVHSYVAEVRLRKAIDLLASTSLTAKEISHRLGFAAPWGFSTAFRAATGQTPTQFRRDFRMGRAPFTLARGAARA